jgi:hypothetical protein
MATEPEGHHDTARPMNHVGVWGDGTAREADVVDIR